MKEPEVMPITIVKKCNTLYEGMVPILSKKTSKSSGSISFGSESSVTCSGNYVNFPGL